MLAGEAPPSAGPAKLAEIAEIRKAAQAGPDAVTRRLLTSLGSDLGALAVIAVSVRAEKPVARVLAVASGMFLPIDFTGTIERQSDGSSRVKWTDVLPLVSASLGVGKGAAPAPYGSGSPAPSGSAPAAGSAQPGPLAPKKEEPQQRSFWTSPWTWAGVGVVVAAGVVVFALAQANSNSNNNSLHLQGRVDR